MDPDRTGFLARYQPWRPVVEPGFWIVFLGLQAAINSWTVWLDLAREGQSTAFWEPAVWECSSHLLVLLLIPAIIAFEKRFPLGVATFWRNFPYHLAATLVFSAVHVLGMVALRKLAYATQNETYSFGAGPLEFAYEYLKDVRTYFALIIAIAFYRLVLLRWQGEASLLQVPDEGPPVEPVDRPERILVRKLGREFLLPAADIEWIQAWGNYVNLHVRGHDYPLRATMSSIEERLDPKRFARVHRSYIVNLDMITEIESLESGDAKAKLANGSLVPISRRYRDELRKRAL